MRKIVSAPTVNVNQCAEKPQQCGVGYRCEDLDDAYEERKTLQCLAGMLGVLHVSRLPCRVAWSIMLPSMHNLNVPRHRREFHVPYAHDDLIRERLLVQCRAEIRTMYSRTASAGTVKKAPCSGLELTGSTYGTTLAAQVCTSPERVFATSACPPCVLLLLHTFRYRLDMFL